ncbi:MAG: radical SAM protein [Candidatus Aminicenantes bacterium]|nr:MAG: radical SAM protein [Candidatus Aminicenantes bacterium]
MSGKKILLMLLPFWTPFVPPLGIACLKSYMKKYKFNIKTCDLNPEPEFWDIHNKYMEFLKKNIPVEKQGNVNTTGFDVLMTHSLAYLNKQEEKDYFHLLQEMLFENFFYKIEIKHIHSLDSLVEKLYMHLENHLDKIFAKEQPDVFGVSVFNSNLGPSLFALKEFKKKKPGGITILGGGILSDQLHPDSFNFKNILARMGASIDKIVIGEGEVLLFKLLRGELPDNQKVFTIKDINNEVLDFTNVGVPDFGDFDLGKYPELTSYASRSCPFQCKFCSETLQWGKYRKKKMKQVVDELIDLHKKYNYSLFLLGDSLLDPIIMDLSREFISRGDILYWDGYLRVSDMAGNPGNAMLWRSGGFYRARLGIESGSERVLKLMDKKVTPHHIHSTLKSLARAGIKTTTYWVTGYPGETEEDFQQTLDLIAQLKDYIFSAECHAFWFYPSGQVNSEKWVKEKGITPLYSEKLIRLLMLQSWVLNSEPRREEVHDRLFKFKDLCNRLDIPNPYNYADWYHADERWKMLHKTAPPSMLELKQGNHQYNFIKESSTHSAAKEKFKIEGDYEF